MPPADLRHCLLPALLIAIAQPSDASTLRHAVESQQTMAMLPDSVWDDQSTGPITMGSSQSVKTDTFRLDSPSTTSGLDVQAQPVLPSSSDTSSIGHSPLPELPNTPQQDIRHELWQQWGEKFALLQQENIALRDQLNRRQQDAVSDIRLDSATMIENQALKDQVAELEKEVETLRAAAANHKAPHASGPDGLHNPAQGDTIGQSLARTHSD